MALHWKDKILPVLEARRKSGEREILSRELLKLVSTEDVDERSSTDIERIKYLIEEGADPNYNGTDYGETILHKVAANWGPELADLLIENVSDLNVTDDYGRTPLHAAAKYNNSEMVFWLLVNKARMEIRTVGECQTALHYAARFDSIESIQALLRGGADIEARDYRGRTPLHLAVDLFRNKAAEYLISLPTPAEIKVTEENGEMCISAMIKTMPKVAYKALDQLHQIDADQKKESFILAYLEPDLENKRKGVKAPLASSVGEKKRAILSHPVMQALIEVKWKYNRYYFYIHLAFYFLFLIVWTALIVHPTAQEQHIYEFPRDIYRLILEFILFVLFAMMVAEELGVIIRSIKRHYQYRRSCKKKTREDFNTLIMSRDEIEFLKECYVRPNYIPDQPKDLFMIIGFLSELLIIVVVALHITDIVAHTKEIANYAVRMAAFASILLWIRLIRYFRAIPSMGTLISVFVEIRLDIFRYFLLAVVIYIPYTVSFWVSYGGPQSSNNSIIASSTKKDLSTPFDVGVMAFRITLIDSYPYDDLRVLDQWQTLFLVAPYILILNVIGLNLFIALLTNTFQRVYDDGFANSLLQRATLINSLEEQLFCRCFYRRYHRYITRHCNPLVKKYKHHQNLHEIQLLKAKKHMEEIREAEEMKLEELNEMAPELTAIETKVNEDINTLKQELISAVGEMLTKEQDVEMSLKSLGSGGVKRSRGMSRMVKRPTSRDKEWKRKLESTVYKPQK